MVNVTITQTTNAIKVDFGDLSSVVGHEKACWNKDAILNIKLFSSIVEVNTLDSFSWHVSLDGTNNSLVIDSIDGVVPSNLADLYDKLSGLIE